MQQIKGKIYKKGHINMTPASPQKHRASMGVRQEILNLALLVNLACQNPDPEGHLRIQKAQKQKTSSELRPLEE